MKLLHFTPCHKVKFYSKTFASKNKAKYVAKHSFHKVFVFEIIISENTSVWIPRLSVISKAHRFDRYNRANLSRLLLLLSGDVELNPGPYTGKQY